MNLPQIDRGPVCARGLRGLWHLDTDMQLKATVPDQCTCSTVLWEIKRQDKGGPPSSHGEYDPPALLAHRLGRPVHRVEAFGLPGVFHAHLGVCRTQLARGLDVGEKGLRDHLHRLTVQGKASFGGLLQVGLSWPGAMGNACLFM